MMRMVGNGQRNSGIFHESDDEEDEHADNDNENHDDDDDIETSRLRRYMASLLQAG